MVAGLVVAAFAMIAAGLYAIWTGADMIVLERGWASVIGGSVAATGGMILFGIAMAIRELRRLPDRLEAVHMHDLAHEAMPALPEAPRALSGLVPAAGASAIAAAGLATQESVAKPDSLAPPVTLAGSESKPEPDLQASLFADLAVEKPPAPAIAPDIASPERVEPQLPSFERDLLAAAIEPRREPVFAATEPMPAKQAKIAADSGPEAAAAEATSPAIAPSAPLPQAMPSDQWREIAEASAEELAAAAMAGAPILDIGLSSREAGPVDVEADKAAYPESEHRDETSEVFEPMAILTPELPVVTPTEPVAAPEPEEPLTQEMAAESDAPAAPAAPEAAPERSVVGTYSAGGNLYVMYSDGAIEADTPEGTFRFSSLDELKAYIASGEAETASKANEPA